MRFLTDDDTRLCKVETEKKRSRSCFKCLHYDFLSRVMRKLDFCLCENKGADQLRCNCEADQSLCFRHMDSKISLLLNSEISMF